MSKKKRRPILKSGKIYIMPTRIGFIYGVGALGLLLAASAFNNNLIYLLFFMLTVLGVIAMHQTHENIKSIEISKIQLDPFAAHSTGQALLHIKNHSNDPKHSITLTLNNKHENICSHVHPQGVHRQEVMLQQETRGVYELGRVKLSTVFPLGLFYAWKYQSTQTQYYVYPEPKGREPLSTVTAPELSELHKPIGSHGEDFSEHRKHQPADGFKHVDWKAVARGRPLLVKEFDAGSGTHYLLDFKKLHIGSTEDKLSQLSRWVLDLHQKKQVFAMQLPHQHLPSGVGQNHKTNCLKALAQFGDQNERAS